MSNHRDYHKIPNNYQQDLWPNNNSDKGKTSDSYSLGTTSIVFIGIGGAIVVIVFIVCIIVWIRSSCLKPDRRVQVQVVGRAIQRPSFLKFRSFRRYIEPEIIYYPSPDGSVINYPIQTPYTFPSGTISSTRSGSPKSNNRSLKKLFLNSSSTPPTTRATVA